MLNSTSLSDEGIQEVLLFGSHNSRCVLRGVDRRGNGITVICAVEDAMGRILNQQPFAVLTVLCELMKAKMLVMYYILDSIKMKMECNFCPKLFENDLNMLILGPMKFSVWVTTLCTEQ